MGSSRGLEKELTAGAPFRVFLFPMTGPKTFQGPALLVAAFVRCLRLVARLRPRVTFATGGYVSAPLVLASWFLRVPIVLFLPDVVPGRAIRRLSPLARKIAVTTEVSKDYLPAEKAVVTGYPIRETFAPAPKGQARTRFNVPEDAILLIVFGGSQGSRSINSALTNILSSVLERAHVIHVAGTARLPEVERARSKLSAEQLDRYHLFAFLDGRDMALALSAADLALCRSGASVLGELPVTRTPAILVPLPEGRVHQRENAAYLAAAGAAVVVDDDRLRLDLAKVLDRLLSDRARLTSMADAAASLAKPDATERIASLIEEVAA